MQPRSCSPAAVRSERPVPQREPTAPPLARAAGVYDQSHTATLLDSYEYAMYGKIYKWKQEKPKEAV